MRATRASSGRCGFGRSPGAAARHALDRPAALRRLAAIAPANSSAWWPARWRERRRNAHCAACCSAAGAPAPEFVHSSAQAAGVRNGYREPKRLGDDRWVGAVSAWHLAGCFRAICAVSVGTALTIDVVDCDGVHRGGLIAPGPTLMLQSLLRDTAGIAPRAAASAAARRGSADASGTLGLLATDTRQAIELGCLSAAAALVDRTVTDVHTTPEGPARGIPHRRWRGCGGAAAAQRLQAARRPGAAGHRHPGRRPRAPPGLIGFASMMRIAVLVLVAANLLYFGWSHWVDHGAPGLTAVAAAPRKPAPAAARRRHPHHRPAPHSARSSTTSTSPRPSRSSPPRAGAS